MVSHLFYYQLALLAIIWLFVMLHLTWSEPGLTTPVVPAKPKRKRSAEPKPFAGLTHKPHCALCDQETGETAPAPPRRPDPMPPTHHRPRDGGHLDALLSPHRLCLSRVAVYLAAAAKYRRLTHRLSQEQKGLDERARTASQRPSPPCGRPRSRPCGRTAPAQATSPCRFPPPHLAHAPAGCGHGGTRYSKTSRSVHTWSVNPAAIAGV
jgi:hypothetical protein